MLLFPIGFFYACFMVASKRIAAVAAQGKCSFPWDGIGLAHKRQLRFHRAVCKTAIFTQRGPRKSIEDDFMGKRRNCGVNEHLCFCTDANDTQQVTTRCIIAPFILKGSERCGSRAGRESSLQEPAQLLVDGMQFSAAPSPDRW